MMCQRVGMKSKGQWRLQELKHGTSEDESSRYKQHQPMRKVMWAATIKTAFYHQCIPNLDMELYDLTQLILFSFSLALILILPISMFISFGMGMFTTHHCTLSLYNFFLTFTEAHN